VMISVKVCREVRGWVRYKPKVSTSWVGRTNVTGDRETTGRFAIAKTRT